MRMHLEHDSETGRLMLVMSDLWNGQHEETRYTVADPYGNVVRRRQDLDGVTVAASGLHDGVYYARPGGVARSLPFRTLAGEKSETVRTPCRKAGNARRKCALCNS